MADHKSLGESLVEKGLLSEADHRRVLEVSKETGESLLKILIRQRLVQEDSIVSFFEKQLGIRRLDILNTPIGDELIQLVPEELARQYELVPVEFTGDTLTVAMIDPLNVLAVDELRLRTGYTIEVGVASEGEIMAAIEKYYGAGAAIEEVVKSIDLEEATDEEEEASTEQLQFAAKEAPVVKIVNLLVVRAVREGASDIHLEPEEKNLRVRFRIDGVLHEASTLPKGLQAAVISRIKIMCDMNIATKRIPQDGRFQVKVQGKRIDLRVSTLPTLFGENVVMRLLDVTSVSLGIDQLGMGDSAREAYERMIKNPHGIILVTGPTGSGKTTTLYATLNVINTVDKDIVTMEDPVEYQLKSIRQSQVNPKAGLTFATGLRSILRQDPDIIMVGEIRDVETAEIAVHAALTGHLVFSTLHTNDAPGALTRLVDMGVEPFLVSSSVLAVLAQRLVRTICQACKKEVKPSPEVLKRIGVGSSTHTFYRGSGCPACKQTGYRGRLGIYELMEVTDKMGEMVVARATSQNIKKLAQENGMKTLFDDGLEKARKGLTTIEEVLRVTQIT